MASLWFEEAAAEDSSGAAYEEGGDAGDEGNDEDDEGNFEGDEGEESRDAPPTPAGDEGSVAGDGDADADAEGASSSTNKKRARASKGYANQPRCTHPLVKWPLLAPHHERGAMKRRRKMLHLHKL